MKICIDHVVVYMQYTNLIFLLTNVLTHTALPIQGEPLRTAVLVADAPSACERANWTSCSKVGKMGKRVASGAICGSINASSVTTSS
mmetsp:Transcript_3178/g.8547  ORF Transcript_3178/g.8547 Transcript_3178/m.8547 type:complete len:87 (-) Transcript_3178:681-941(-)